MTTKAFVIMAYREGNVARIREELLKSVKRNEYPCDAQNHLVAHIREKASETEAAWLKKYDAAFRQVSLF